MYCNPLLYIIEIFSKNYVKKDFKENKNDSK